MAGINFVPDDYIQNRDYRRTNTLCLILLFIVMGSLGGAFGTIRFRQDAYAREETAVNEKMHALQVSIQQFEQLQSKRKEMMKTALTTAQLLEPIPRSVILASLTNNLPEGTSLLDLELEQEESSKTKSGPQPRMTKYEKNKQKQQSQETAVIDSPERNRETSIKIIGVAPSDLQVADYIKQMDESPLLQQVSLVESVEYKIDDMVYRKFKLTAQLNNHIELSEEEMGRIKTLGQHRSNIF